MHQIIGGIVLGAIVGKASGGLKSNKLRPLVRKTVKTGLIAARKASEFGRSLRREANALVAEAKAELEDESRSAGK